MSDASPSPAAARRPHLRWMLAHPAHALALGLGSGLSPVAPGTAGTLAAWLAWVLLAPRLTPAQQGWALLIGLAVGTWAAARSAASLRSADPGAIVIDEVIAFGLVLWLVLPAGWVAQCAAFVLFRFFDAVKPGPVGWADRVLHGTSGWRQGLGIMLDDLVAAFCTLLVLALGHAWRG